MQAEKNDIIAARVSFAFSVIVLVVMALIFLSGCKTTKQSKQTYDSTAVKKVDSIYVSKFIYNDTGSTVTYYRDSVIFRNDTFVQLIDRVVTKNGKTIYKYDTVSLTKTDTVRVATTITTKATKSSNWALNYWFWIAVILFAWNFRHLLYKFV